MDPGSGLTQMDDRLLVISPVHNEAAHIEQVVQSVLRQRRLPDLWIVVDDNSDDGTSDLLASLLGDVAFARLVQAPPGHIPAARDRNAVGGPERAWHIGLQHAHGAEFTHVAKLDGDIVLPPDYFQQMLARFHDNPGLGVAGGAVTEWRRDRWWVMPTPADHPTAPARVYSTQCYDDIGGMPPYMGADVITTIYAKMRGYDTVTYADLPVRHLRPMGAADGMLRGRRRQGAYQYAVHYSFWWVLARSVVVAVRFRPFVASGLFYLAGYIGAALRRAPRVKDREWRRFARAEYRERLVSTVKRRFSRDYCRSAA